MFIGVDLGGTKIAAALVSATGKIVTDVNIPTEASKGKTHVLGAINKAIRHLIQTSPEPVKAIGLGVPGPILYEKGIVIGPPQPPRLETGQFEKDPGKRIFPTGFYRQ
ncbi:MAG: ROK family protein [Candidatus Margulisiibacteriota bacterium]